jgi:hypothetical protein
MANVINPVQNMHRYSTERMGLKIKDNFYMHNLLFADDQVVIIRGVEDANNVQRRLEEEDEKWRLKIKCGKTEYLGTDHSGKLKINGNKIPVVKQLKYLGSIFQEKGSSVLEIEKKILVKQEELLAC